jgi:hypothetical protein
VPSPRAASVTCFANILRGHHTPWFSGLPLKCTTFFGRFRIDPATALQIGHEMVWMQ